jgi:photosystem II stability/assembly factor-like uncharacterized protein
MFTATTGWAATVDRVLRTTDGGRDWLDVTPPATAASSPQGVAAFPVSVAEAWVVRGLVTSGPGASRSSVSHTADGGQTWRSITLPVFAVALITFADAQHGWMLADLDTADGEQGADILRTTDGGGAWAKVSSAADQPGALPLSGRKTGLGFRDATVGWATLTGSFGPPPPAQDIRGFYRTQDGGATWQLAPLSLPTSLGPSGNYYAAGLLPPTFFSPQVGALTVAVGSRAAGGVVASLVYVTRDGGDTWAPTAPADTEPDATSLLDSSHWWITADTGADGVLFSTADGGQHWANMTPGALFAHVSALSFASATQGWAIGSAGLLRTTDGGHTWTVLAPAPQAAS